MYRIFATNLRAALDERGWTQEKLAREMNVSNRAVSCWCLAETVPQASNLERLAKELGYDPGWFYSDHSMDEAAA